MSKSEVYDYIWHEFDQHHVDFPEPATERMFISKFKRKYVTYLLWHFSSRILTLDDKFELPNNSILHVADNFEHFDTPVDTPDLDNNLFVQNESFLKYLLHIRTFNTTGPIHYDDKYIYRQAGLPANLMKYRSMNGNKYKYLRDFKDIPRKESALTIINHNPLFRIKMFGRLQKYRRVMQILASIFNTAIELAPLGKQQYIVLPWGEEYFGISDFIRSRDNLTFATIKHPESLQYIFMMHLVNYFWNTATTSMFSMIPRESLDKIYIVLQHNDKYIFYNLNALKDINENNRVYRKVVNQLNWLAVLGMPDANITPEVQELVNKHKAAELLDDPAKEEEDVPAVKLPTERKLKEKEDDGTAVDSDITVITPKNEKKEPANEKEADAMEQVTAAAIKHAAEAVKQTQQSTAQRQAAKPKRTTVSIAVPEVHATITDTKNHTDINAVIKRAVNVTKLADNMLKKDADNDYMDQVDKAADQFIEDRETLTPAAKRYFKTVAVKYKKLQIDNVPLEKLLKDTSEITLSDTRIDPKKLGNVTDPSSLQCTLAAYDQDYIHKTYRKHIAGILTSFQKNGVYLVGLKTEHVLTDLHNYTEYSCQYEDIDGKKSTIKFKLPNIDSEGCVVIDGVKQAVRKQRAPLPIVKIAADTVALTSNYNKARVKRCNNVAHSFIAYVHRLFTDKTKTNVSITYGNELVNLPLSYEYTSLALKYAYVKFTGRDNSQYELCFSYSKRNKHFDGKESLLQELEAQYGVYFGKTKTTWLFINNTNRVSIISKTKGEVSLDFSLLEICKLAVNEEAYIKLKPLTEWANFEVLDGTFPVIFMLAYRYGLRAILDYLGVKYTITENRSKTIVGENTIEGTESFDVKASLARVQYLNELNKSGIDKNKIIIGASAALVAYGLLDTPNKDLDISIEDNYKKTLINKGVLIRNIEDGATHWVVSNTHIDAGVDGPDQQKFSYTELKKLGVTIINGYTFISLEGMIKFYEKCKELFPDDEEKQQKYDNRIALIEQALDGTAGTEAFVRDKISGDMPEYDGEYEDTGKDTIVYTNNESVLPAMEAMRRLVRPRLGDVTLYLTAKSDANENQEATIQLRGVVITVKLGTTATVKRQVVAYNGSTFTTKDKDTLPRKLVDKLSDYFNCGRSKISRANVQWLPADKPLPSEVAKIRIMTAVEYSKLSSKIKGDFNKVRVPKRSGMADYSAEMEDLATTIKYNSRPNDIHIKFADRVLHINRYPLVHSLIVAGLCNYDLTKYSLAEFESRDVYYRLLMDKKMSINLIKGLDSFYDLFVDNITYSVLKMMHEPTNVRDLLIRSVTLISTFDHEPPSSGKNHRIRGYEQFAGILYNELSRSFAQYQAKHNANNKFSTNPDSVYLRIIQNGAMVPAESGSPIEDIKRMSAMTYGGTGGRNAESFVQSDRHYEASDIGVVCEATVDNKNAGFNASVSYNPNIANTLGMSETKSIDDLQPSQILSPHALLFPFSCNDDTKRINFIQIQCAHLVPVEGYDKVRVRTGYERVLAHRCSKNFAGTAKRNGKVTNIDERARLVEVTYNDGDKEVFPYGSEYLPFDSIEIESKLECNVKLGQKVETGDVITYNSDYFKPDVTTGQVDMSTGVLSNVVFMEMDTTLEDGVEISERLSQKLTMSPVNLKVVSLSGKSLIHKCRNIGDMVAATDELMIFEEDPTATEAITTDEDTLLMLSELNRRTPHAGHPGTIVKIDAYYSCDPDQMHPTVKELVKRCVDERNRRYRMARNSMSDNDYPPSAMIEPGSKYKGVMFTDDTVVLVFHIQEHIKHGVGDKLVVGNQLKCTCGGIFPKPIYSESGTEIDAFFSMMSTNKRIVLSPYMFGITSRILEKLEDDICLEYFGEPRDEK